MSKYTTEVRFICEEACGLLESKGYNDIDSIITKAIPKIFSFNFPIFDENYRSVLELKILKHFYTREIGEETVGLWKLRLDTKLNEIMPYYNKLYSSELIEFNPLYSVSYKKEYDGENASNNLANEQIVDDSNNYYEKEISKNNVTSSYNNENGTTNSNTNNNKATRNDRENKTNNEQWDAYSDTPQGSLNNIGDNSYLTNARNIDTNINEKTTDNNISTEAQNNSTSNTYENRSNNVNAGEEKEKDTTKTNYDRKRNTLDKRNTTENYLEKVVGYNGINPNKMLNDYRETFLNIDMMVINELDCLFMQLW